MSILGPAADIQLLAVKVLATLVAITLAFGAGFYYGHTNSEAAWSAKVAKQQAEAYKAETGLREELVQRSKAYAESQAENAGRLASAIAGLRSRPERMPEPARATCKGASGAELSRTDGEFLEREAARANSCIEQLNEVRGAYEDARKRIQDFNSQVKK